MPTRYAEKRKKIPDVFEMAEALDRLSMDSSTDSYGYHSHDMMSMPLNQFSQDEHFPEHLFIVLRSLLGNKMCVDCHKFKELPWASVTFGVLMCEECAFEHISSGLAETCTEVRSLTKNAWNLEEVIALLEGGNTQFLKCIGVNFPDEERRGSTGNADLSNKAQRRGSLLNRSQPQEKTDGADFQKYRKKTAKLYVKKLSDRVEVVTNTFGRKSFNTRFQSRGIEEPTFKPMRRLSQLSTDFDDRSTYDAGGSYDPRSSIEPKGSFDARQSFDARPSFDGRPSLGIRSSFTDPKIHGYQ